MVHITTKVDMDALHLLVEQAVENNKIKDDTCLTIENFKWEVSSLNEDILIVTPIELHI